MEIGEYSFGSIVIDGEKYKSDVIIYRDHVDSNWWRVKGHSLCKKDIEGVIREKPQVVVVGTGNFGYMSVSDEVVRIMKDEGIDLVVQKTEKACKTFNQLKKEKDVIACLHLTC